MSEFTRMAGAIFAVLGYEITIDDQSSLLGPDLYAEILALLIPQHHDFIRRTLESQDSPGAKLQQLLNLLQQEVPELEEAGLSGHLIAKGDKAHLMQLLNLLYQLAEYVAMTGDQEDKQNYEHTRRQQQNRDAQIAQIMGQDDVEKGVVGRSSKKPKQKSRASSRARAASSRRSQGRGRGTQSQLLKSTMCRKQDIRNPTLRRQQAKYDTYLNDYMRELQGIQRKVDSQRGNEESSLKEASRNRKAISQMLQAGRMKASLQLKARDQKDRFYARVNKFLFKQQKQKQIQLAKEAASFKARLAKDTHLKLLSMENQHNTKMDLLREAASKQSENPLREAAEKERTRRSKQQKREEKVLGRVRDKYSRQRQKLELMYGAEGWLERRLIALYKRV